VTKKIPSAVSEYMRKIGAKGGKNGKGKPKKRTKSQKKVDTK
jgi:hypothetical protein